MNYYTGQEGFGRYSYKENLKFCYYARGSSEETKDWIRKAYNRNLIKENEKQKIESFLKEFPIKFNTYIRKIKEYINNE
ncbi:MAG: four helix bundle protein [Candidatus Cloacimonetes bacterium]|nr:four helix bundle protein [Candidatus Cloacimonadota bacterium]